MTCAPACDELTYGYLLSIEIDGRGTVMTCNKVEIFSWQGQASLGGYIGADSASLFSALSSGAAGTCLGKLTADAGISTDLVIRAGQAVIISGDPALVVLKRVRRTRTRPNKTKTRRWQELTFLSVWFAGLRELPLHLRTFRLPHRLQPLVHQHHSLRAWLPALAPQRTRRARASRAARCQRAGCTATH